MNARRFSILLSVLIATFTEICVFYSQYANERGTQKTHEYVINLFYIYFSNVAIFSLSILRFKILFSKTRKTMLYKNIFCQIIENPNVLEHTYCNSVSIETFML